MSKNIVIIGPMNTRDKFNRKNIIKVKMCSFR